MKKLAVVALALAMSACVSNRDEMGMFHAKAPKIVNWTDKQVTLYDPNGVDRQAGLDYANKYCGARGQTAEFLSKGGADNACVSKQMDYCLTYACITPTAGDQK